MPCHTTEDVLDTGIRPSTLYFRGHVPRPLPIPESLFSLPSADPSSTEPSSKDPSSKDPSSAEQSSTEQSSKLPFDETIFPGTRQESKEVTRRMLHQHHNHQEYLHQNQQHQHHQHHQHHRLHFHTRNEHYTIVSDENEAAQTRASRILRNDHSSDTRSMHNLSTVSLISMALLVVEDCSLLEEDI